MKAILLNLSAWTMLPIMDGFAKYLSYSLPILQIVWARYFFTVLLFYLLCFFFKKNLKGYPKVLKITNNQRFAIIFS